MFTYHIACSHAGTGHRVSVPSQEPVASGFSVAEGVWAWFVVETGCAHGLGRPASTGGGMGPVSVAMTGQDWGGVPLGLEGVWGGYDGIPEIENA